MKKKVLIVDDEPSIVEILQELLSDYTTLTASNGKEALEQTKVHQPDLILSDVSMPQMTGLQMLQELRSQGNKVAVVFISAFGDAKNLRTAWQLGALDFVDKPFSVDAILSTVKMALMYQSDQKNAEAVLSSRADGISPRESLTLSLSSEVIRALNTLAIAKGIPVPNLVEELLEKSLNTKKPS